MEWKKELKVLGWLGGAFLVAFFLPVGSARFDGSVMEGFHLVRWYAREHVVLCLLPAFFIAGAISVFIRQASVMKYLGTKAHPVMAYGVASVSGTILAVCSCTVLPLFGGIYKRGAGLGPAVAFLYSGPAINVLAIVLTARVLGLEMGLVRTVGAVIFSVVAGLAMHLFFRKEESARAAAQVLLPEPVDKRPLWQTAVTFAAMVAVLVFANWGAPKGDGGFFGAVYAYKWIITAVSAVVLGVGLVRWFQLKWIKFFGMALSTGAVWALFPKMPVLVFAVGLVGLGISTATSEGELGDWFASSWDFTKQVTPLLLVGVLVAGFLLGRPGHEGFIPSSLVSSLVGGNGFFANLFSSVVAAFMYFATLTEVPILQGLMGSGMGKGPALTLLLAGPALSLPSMLVLRQIVGTKKTMVYISIVVVLATFTGWVYGFLS
ncbi:MAG: permease [Elusimicrobia bacterium]|nr:permease [Elusimicrobiota bacterium]